MAKLTLTDLTSSYRSNTALNANFALIETAMENTLSRDGTTPNAMSASLDMGSQLVINQLDPVSAQDGATKNYVDGLISTGQANVTASAASAAAALVSENAASSSASAASTSETNAATSETNAAASYDSFDDRYLGAKSTAPTLDNDSNALLDGALYFNDGTTPADGPAMYVYDLTNTTWIRTSDGIVSVTANEFTGDGATVAFTISGTPPSDGHLIVTVDGVSQPVSSYSVSGTTLTFTTAPPTDSLIESRGFEFASYSSLDLTSYVTKTGSDTLSNKTHTDPILNGTLSGTAFLDEDTMSSDSAIAAASQQSIKAYVDTHADGAIQASLYGYVADCVANDESTVNDDGSITASDATLTVTNSVFVAGDVGKSIVVHGAGAAGALLRTTIASYNSATSVELTATAGTTVSNAEIRWGTDNTAFLQAAIDAAKTIVDDQGPTRIVAQAVSIPPGLGLIMGEVILYRGVTLRGTGSSTTGLVHGGGSQACIQCDTGVTNNNNIRISDLAIYGAGSATTYGFAAHYCIKGCGAANLNIYNCNDNLYLDRSYTFDLENVVSDTAVRHGLNTADWTQGTARNCRFDNNGTHGVYMFDASTGGGQNVLFTSCQFQLNGQSGVHGEDIASAEFLSCWFEGNNQDDSSYSDVKFTDNADTAGKRFSFIDCYNTSTGSGGTGMSWIEVDRASVVNVISCQRSDSGANYDYALKMGANVGVLNVVGSPDLAANTASYNLNAAVKLVESAGPNSGLFNGKGLAPAATDFLHYKLPAAQSTMTYEGASNTYMILDAPANRRREWRFAVAGTDKFFMGIGDSDETLSGDFYIGQASGGTDGSLGLMIEVTTGNVHIGGSTADEKLQVSGNVKVDSDDSYLIGGVSWSSGSGTPEAAVTAPVGSLFSRTDGGAGTSLYVKETGAGNTGWVGK